MNEKVCAVVVTRNRKELLRECLLALSGQTRVPDHILVVDNASTDGTYEMLKMEFPEAEVLRLPENQGGAGGFHEGMRRAYELGFDWLWLMDDDGLPVANTLEKLLSDTSLEFKGCLVLAKENPTRTAFTYPLPGGDVTDDVSKIKETYSRGVISGFLNPYNGCLVRRSAVSQIGFPIKELFIWGDEAEYFLRARRAGLKVGTLLDAHFLHPRDRQRVRRIRILTKSVALPFSEDPGRFFLIVRNLTYIALSYFTFKALVKLALYPFFFGGKIPLLIKAYYSGVRMFLSLRNRV